MKVAINGFGRIGRNLLRAVVEKGFIGEKDSPLEITAINDLAKPDDLAHLLKYDSVHGKLPVEVKPVNDGIIVNGCEIKVYAEPDPVNLPWKELGIDVVVESTGRFRKAEEAKKHIEAGAKKVVISAPAKGEDITIVMGVNEHLYNHEKHHIISNASCTTNCLAPVAKVLHERFGIVQGMMTTVHSFTNDQRILDLPHKDKRRARAAAMSIIPTTTGAAKAVGLVLPELKGRLTGMAMRVPTPNVSVVDLVCQLKEQADVEEINSALQKAAAGELKGILDYTSEPLVSKDFNGNPHSAIVDGLSTMAGEKMAKVVAWYDNEWGYSNRILDLIIYIGEKGLN
ncbi:MAG: type I glyceraldehyde-3-phosphate dehydrogenase [Desulfotomaculum sp.]|nr:type I glyceraldehyde-3-phosphate dehydrogenase [Desulfotomaculum sp.]